MRVLLNNYREPAEVQTFQKAGIKGLVIEPWFGVFSRSVPEPD